MSKSRSTHTTATDRQQPQPGARLHAVLLAFLVAICVARPLLPSETVAKLGDGQPFNMLLLCLAVVTSLAAVGQGGLRARWTPTDVAVLVLCGCYAASALRGAAYASPRPAINMLFEWTSLGLVYFLTRQLVRSAAQSRVLVAVMIALAVVLSSLGYYQYFVSMPADRAEYARDPDAMLRRSGQWYAPHSIERQQFESRMRSTEPLGTFALTNSLAGYLAPWLLVSVGIAASVLVCKPVVEPHGALKAKQPGTKRTLLTLAVVVLLVGGCLILTKSRSAYVASAVGLLLLALTTAEVRGRLRWPAALGLLAVVAVLVGGAVAVRGLDRAVLSEAGKSLGYRLEYWQSTLAMIHDHPWFGCGPGNFQDSYMHYKLPQASEEIQDPHNLFFEVWGTAGTPAFLALVAVLGLFAWQTWRRTQPGSDSGGSSTLSSSLILLSGGAAGLLLANFVGPLVDLDFDGPQAWAGLAIGGLVLLGLWPWIRGGRMPTALAPLAVAVLVVHLLAAGGISFPGVAYSFWILVALGVNQTLGAQAPADEPRSTALPWGGIAAMSLAAGLATTCYLTAYGPVLRSTSAMYRAQNQEQRHDVQRYEAALVEASIADPFAATTWQLLAELDFQRLENRGAGEATRQQFDRALRTMLLLRPQSSAAFRLAGGWTLQLFQRTADPDDARLAIEYYRRASELYPNSAVTHADLAIALEAVGKHSEAQPEAARARELDAIMPHADKKLPAAVDQQLQALERTDESP